MPPLTDTARDLLTAANVGVLSTVMPDGSPQSSAVWVDTEHDRILVATTTRTLKYRNVVRDPRVALTVTGRDDPYRELSVRGHVVAIRADGGALIDHLSQRYYGLRPYPYRAPGEEWVALIIEAVRVRFDAYDHPS